MNQSISKKESTAGPVKVAVRCRPLLLGETSCLTINRKTVVVASEKLYTFDHAFNGDCTNAEIQEDCVEPFVLDILNGINGTVIAYGQTGSGKTYTMGTNYNKQSSPDNDDTVGIIPRVLRSLFHQMNEKEKLLPVYISFLEFYGETIFDLLSPGHPTVQLHETKNGIQLRNLKEMQVANVDQALSYLEEGSVNRTTGPTARNKSSSRSHAIFTIAVKHNISGKETLSKLHLVDLAGSEGVKKSQTEGNRRREGININLGLLSLGQVITSLSSKKAGYIPYRNSLLTRFLKDSLNGTSQTLMISCISPEVGDLMDTIETLRYSSSARGIPGKSLRLSNSNQAENPFRKHLDMIPPTPVSSSSLASMNSGISTPMTSAIHINLNLSPIENESILMPPPPPPPPRNFLSPKVPLVAKENDLSNFISPIARRVHSLLEKTLVKKLMEFSTRNGLRLDHEANESVCNSPELRKKQGEQYQEGKENCRSPEHNETSGSPLQLHLSSSEGSDNSQGLPTAEKRKRAGRDPPQPVRKSKRAKKTMPKRFRDDMVPDQECSQLISELNENKTAEQEIFDPAKNRALLDRYASNLLKILNTKSVKDIEKIPGIGPKSAQMIHTNRVLNGKLKDLKDLKSVIQRKPFYKTFLKSNFLYDHII